MKQIARISIFGITMLAATTAMAGVTFFENENFGGRQFNSDRTVENFSTIGFNDRARSVIVEGGSWEVCADSGFNGACTVLAPGRYPTLGSMGSQISSARMAGNGPRYEQRGDQRNERAQENHRGRASATLFSGPNMAGRAITLGGDGTSNLDGQFNDRASSIRVERGYWIFCSEAQFRGECRTFGPGDYASLPAGLDNRISSGRMISNNYPYSGNPNWR